MRAIRDAMDEAFDQRETVVYPHPAEGKALVTRAHEELSRQFGGGGGGGGDLLCPLGGRVRRLRGHHL